VICVRFLRSLMIESAFCTSKERMIGSFVTHVMTWSMMICACSLVPAIITHGSLQDKALAATAAPTTTDLPYLVCAMTWILVLPLPSGALRLKIHSMMTFCHGVIVSFKRAPSLVSKR